MALMVVGVGVTALLGTLAQQRRSLRMAATWSEEQTRACDILMEELRRWESLRSDVARRAGLATHGEDPRLGPWSWKAEPEVIPPGQAVALYCLTLQWQGHEMRTHAALRLPQA